MGWATDAGRSPSPSRPQRLPQILPAIIRTIAVDVPDLMRRMPAGHPEIGPPVAKMVLAVDPDASVAIAVNRARDIPDSDSESRPTAPPEQPSRLVVIEEGAQPFGGQRLTHRRRPFVETAVAVRAPFRGEGRG
jgi:hypothetical protein